MPLHSDHFFIFGVPNHYTKDDVEKHFPCETKVCLKDGNKQGRFGFVSILETKPFHHCEVVDFVRESAAGTFNIKVNTPYQFLVRFPFLSDDFSPEELKTILIKYFGHFGEILDINIMRSYAFINFRFSTPVLDLFQQLEVYNGTNIIMNYGDNEHDKFIVCFSNECKEFLTNLARIINKSNAVKPSTPLTPATDTVSSSSTLNPNVDEFYFSGTRNRKLENQYSVNLKNIS
jgi:hypothetical protein